MNNVEFVPLQLSVKQYKSDDVSSGDPNIFQYT